jgi:hypothetical protein
VICSKCGSEPALYGIAFHYLSLDWRQMIKLDQTFGPLCSPCRKELISWLTTSDTRVTAVTLPRDRYRVIETVEGWTVQTKDDHGAFS